MLVLSRRFGEEIVIDGHIRVVVIDVQGKGVRLGISAPPAVRVDRQEVHERRSLVEKDKMAHLQLGGARFGG